MIREIIKGEHIFQKAIDATIMDKQIAIDLLDTLNYNISICVGMAANMIGFNKRIICVYNGISNMVMINPTIIDKKNKYQTTEGCLSLLGVRKTIRYKEITISYLDINFIKHVEKFSGFTAQIIQHEIDHLNAIII